MRYVDGPIAPVDCVSQTRPKVCEFPGGCHFYSFWAKVRQAISDVVDKTTFADLIRESHERGRRIRRLDYLARSGPKPSNTECSGPQPWPVEATIPDFDHGTSLRERLVRR